MNKEIYLIRHTTPDVEKGTCYGQTDLALAESFQTELAEVQATLPALHDLPIYTSPLQRCRLLAEALAYPLGLALTQDTRLMEMHFGAWEMQKWADIPPEILQNWMKDFVETPAPEGESHRLVHQRVVSFWEELTALPAQTMLVVTHYGVIQSLLAHLLHIPLDKLFKIDMGFGAVVRVTWGAEDYCKIKFLR